MKTCSQCGKNDQVRYKGANKPTSLYYCRKCIANRPDVKAKKSALTKKQWEDPNFRALVVKNSSEIWADPVKSVNMAKIRTGTFLHDMMIKRWQDPIYRAKMTLKLLTTVNFSSLQTTLYSILTDLNVKFFREYDSKPPDQECIIGPYSFDCVVPRDNKPTLLIECQGDYWHSIQKNELRDNRKSSYISNNLSSKYELKYIWEHEFLQKDRVIDTIKHWLGLTKLEVTTYDFNQVQIADCSAKDYKLLLNKYHYLVNAGRGGICYGAYLNKELIGVVIFSPLLRQNIEESIGCKSETVRELSRLCVHPKYQMRNFTSWFVSRCIKRLPKQYSTIISYCDTTFNHDGAIYKACNFIQDKEVRPDYWYVAKDGWVMHKKTMYNHATRMHMTEGIYADKLGFIKIYGNKKLRFVYRR